MRDIKFRAKKKSDGKWVYGAYHKHLPYTPAPMGNEPVPESDYEHCIVQDGFSDWNMPRGFNGYEIDPETVGQLTGLKDKNGVEIYEGDIVRAIKNYPGNEQKNFVSKFRSNTATFAFQETVPITKDDGCYYYDMLQIKDVEVIGNIYENPELLK